MLQAKTYTTLEGQKIQRAARYRDITCLVQDFLKPQIAWAWESIQGHTTPCLLFSAPPTPAIVRDSRKNWQDPGPTRYRHSCAFQWDSGILEPFFSPTGSQRIPLAPYLHRCHSERSSPSLRRRGGGRTTVPPSDPCGRSSPALLLGVLLREKKRGQTTWPLTDCYEQRGFSTWELAAPR